MKQIFDTFKSAIIQIATPQSTGTGFYLKTPNLIVTNNHVVEDNQRVVIEGQAFEKQLSKVVYVDSKYDIAFLKIPEKAIFPDIQLAESQILTHGDIVGAIGHPFGLKYTATDGIISNIHHVINDIRYLQHSAAINPGNSGGPLVNSAGAVIGVNTFIIGNSNNIGFALPSEYLQEAILAFQGMDSEDVARCSGCSTMVSERTVENKSYCPNCGFKVTRPSDAEEFVATGVSKTIENLLAQTNHDVALSRKGLFCWEIKQGSAKIEITYHEKTGLIVADAYLCRLPKENIKPIYEYLLRQNFELENLAFSVHEQDVILSLLIFDRYLNEITGMKMLQQIFEKADYFDNILVEEYGAQWKLVV